MKVYTKTGDKGETSLIGGKRVPKYHDRIEAYGTVDELIAHIGLVRDLNIPAKKVEVLIEIQDRLMTCAAILAADCDDCQTRVPLLTAEDITFLEKEIDEMETSLLPLQSFVLPGGHVAVSQCHVARTVCRRAERVTLKLSSILHVPQEVIQYLNRLSDYLFVLSRVLSKEFSAREISWKPRL